MEDILDHVKTIEPLSDKEVFTKLWLEPRKVFEFINDAYYEKYMILLMILGGISNTLDRAETRGIFDRGDLWVSLLLVTFVGALFGWIGFYFYGALVSLTGKWIKGTAGVREIVRVSVYSSIPSTLGIVVFFLQFIVFKGGIFSISSPVAYYFLFYFFILIALVLGIWSFVLNIVGISVVQNFSIGKAILNLILPIFLIIAIIIPIVLLVVALR
ncbi:MAG: YIP1 family protein [Crocinitomicaceae bacterium]|nr:YIP1 family protein [Crocinitomicaceae bacterium]